MHFFHCQVSRRQMRYGLAYSDHPSLIVRRRVATLGNASVEPSFGHDGRLGLVSALPSACGPGRRSRAFAFGQVRLLLFRLLHPVQGCLASGETCNLTNEVCYNGDISLGQALRFATREAGGTRKCKAFGGRGVRVRKAEGPGEEAEHPVGSDDP